MQGAEQHRDAGAGAARADPHQGCSAFGVLRFAMGWTFLWAFLDKAFALGFSTGRVLNDAGQTVKIDFGPDAWINGASPTAEAVGLAEGPVRGQHPRSPGSR